MDFSNSQLEFNSQILPENDLKEENVERTHSGKDLGWFGVRHTQALLIFSCFFTTFFLRLNLSVAIVSMTDRNSSNPDFEEYDWNENQKSAVLSSFFWGYLVIQIPAGQLGQHYSPKLLLLFSHLACAILALVTPLAAMCGGWPLLCAVRAAQGLSQGFLVPLSYTLASKWAPPNERNRFVGFSLNGGTLGSTAAFPLCGLLASSSAGWPSIFYVSGALGLIWVLAWGIFGADNPETHRYISLKEKDFIHESLSHTSKNKKLQTPWKEICTSVPVWGLLCAHLSNGWGFALVVTELPSYINSILEFNITSNGLLSALPYLCLWVLTFPVCWLADIVKKRNLLSENVTRKLWTTIAQTGGAVTLIGLGFVGHNAIAAMTLLTITVALSSFIFSGFNINHLDLAPNFAGVLMGITNGLENITTILSPLAVGWIITDSKSVEQWRIVFIVTAVITVTGNVLFLIFGRTDVQEWNKPRSEKDKNKSNDTNL